MKKSIVARGISLLLVFVLSLGALSGCGKKASDKDDEGRTVISVGSWPPKESEALTAMNERKDRFEKANPDVKIEPDNWAFERQTFYAKAAGGQYFSDTFRFVSAISPPSVTEYSSCTSLKL